MKSAKVAGPVSKIAPPRPAFSELVVDADAADVEGIFEGQGIPNAAERIICACPVGESNMEIFRFRGPVSAQGIFDAGASHPTGRICARTCGGNKCRANQFVLQVCKRDTTRAVNQEGIERETEASTDGGETGKTSIEAGGIAPQNESIAALS